MPREILTIQVGQCGNQIGMSFWDLALREHAQRGIVFDDAMSSFFKNNSSSDKVQDIKARSMIVDMEEGVINQLLNSDIGEIFDSRYFIQDVSGAGNNWAHGFYGYGSKYKEYILDKISKNLEECDSPQCFMLMHSIGGGTGSGVGTFILSQLYDHFPELYRFTVSVFPSEDDDVITSPYNSIFSFNQLLEHADCVLPIDNQSLIDICNKVESETKMDKDGDKKTNMNNINNIFDFGKNKKNTKDDNNFKIDIKVPEKKKVEMGRKKPFEKMNSIIAHLLCNFTCSMRFEGSLNVDINDITMNLVPFPRLHFILSSISPLYHVLDKKLEPRKIDQIFSDVFDRNYQLISVDNLYSGVYLASAIIARGNLSISDVNKNISKQKKNLKIIGWNHEGFKIGLCDQPPVNMKYGLLALSNNTVVADIFQRMTNRFYKLYKVKAHTHHYTEYLDISEFDKAISNVQILINEYNQISIPKHDTNSLRIQPLV